MKKSLFLLLGVFVLSFAVVSATCTTDADCGTVGACVVKGSSHLGECVACEDTDKDPAPSFNSINTVTKGTIPKGVWLTTLSYSENMVDTCISGMQVKEYYCRELTGGLSGHLYAYSIVKNCANGEICTDGACRPMGESTTQKAVKSVGKKLNAPALDTGSSFAWALGVLGVLLVGGAAYWFFGRKHSGTQRKKR